MKKIKILISMLLCAVMVLGTVAVGGDGFAEVLDALSVKASAETSGIYTYTVSNGEATITGCDSSISGDITIPSTLGDYPVTSIGDFAFCNCDSLTNIVMDNCVSTIGYYSFGNCSSLKSITVPDSVTSISDCAFYNCTGLTSVTIGNGVTNIGEWAFAYCTELTNITIPGSVKNIGERAYDNCSNLTSITVDNGNAVYDSRNNCNAIINTKTNTLLVGCRNTIIPKNVTKINKGAFGGCTGLKNIIIPNSVTSIGEYAFGDCSSIESITIPNSVTSIGDDAFIRCASLTSIAMSNNITSIGMQVFLECTGLETITIPYGVKSIGYEAFSGCSSLKSITIPDSVTSIGGSAFNGCTSLTGITIPCSVTSIGGWSFCGCSKLETISIGNKETSIGSHAFKYTAYYNDDSNWEDDLLYIDNYLIEAKSNIAGTISIRNGTRVIADSTFEDTGLTSVTIPNSVTHIGDSAFYGCDGLTSITIPNSVTHIDDSAFCHCVSLKSITIGSNVTSIGYFVFYETAYYNDDLNWEDDLLYIDNYLIEAKSNIAGTISIRNGTKVIADKAFFCCRGLTNINIPDSVTSIGSTSFYDIYNITYSDNMKASGSPWFAKCANGYIDGLFVYSDSSKIKLCGCSSSATGTVKIPSGIKCIGDRAFKGCYKLRSIIIPDGVECIDDYAFYGQIEYVHIPSSVTQIGYEIVDSIYAHTYICSDTNDCYAKTYADENDIEFKLCNGHSEKNIYNLGEETYSFGNFGDLDSPGGHCFGMAVTSSGYYTNNLSKSIIGGSDDDALYSFTASDTVKAPICHYLRIQGPGAEYNSIVAGGNIDVNKKIDTESDWNSCVNYVKNHNFDNDGTLNIGMWFASCAGHAVNFLYYRNVEGQDRIYAYDNNYPDYEIYYYLDSDGYIHQSAESLLYDIETDIIGLDLMDVNNYFQLASEFDTKRYIYADKNEIAVEDAKMYYMKCGKDLSDYVMYEISENATEVTVIPLTDNASFVYMDRRYAFGEIDPETYGIIKVPTNDPSVINPDSIFTIKNAPFGDYTADNLVNVATAKTFDYRSIVTITATATDVPEGYHLALYVNGAKVKDGDNKSVSYTYGEIKSDINYTVKIVDSNGNVQKDSNNNDLSKDSRVTVNAGFFKKLAAFFKGLFGTLPKVEVKP